MDRLLLTDAIDSILTIANAATKIYPFIIIDSSYGPLRTKGREGKLPDVQFSQVAVVASPDGRVPVHT